jgi:hypothetical protein
MKNPVTKLILAALGLAISTSAFAFSETYTQGPGEDYYRQFTYVKETSDDGDGEVLIQYRHLIGQSEVAVSPLKKIMVTAFLYFLPNSQDFVLGYEEMIGMRDTPTGEWRYTPNMENGMCPKVIKGQWSAPQDKLILAAGVSGDRATFDSRPAVKLIFNEKVMSPEVKGTELVMDFGYDNSPIEDTLGRGGFCPF